MLQGKIALAASQIVADDGQLEEGVQ